MLMYTNADIILLPNLLEAAKRVSQLSGAYVVVGKRLDVEPTAMPAPHIVVEAVLAGRHQPLVSSTEFGVFYFFLRAIGLSGLNGADSWPTPVFPAPRGAAPARCPSTKLGAGPHYGCKS